MSTDLTPTPGLHRIVDNVDIDMGEAAKVTGRNAGAITYLASRDAETVGLATDVTFRFAANGQLTAVDISQDGMGVTLSPGDYLVRPPGDDEIGRCPAKMFSELYLPA